MSIGPELIPFVVARVVVGRAELARWRLADGYDALPLFSTEVAAAAYVRIACPEPGWRTVRPARPALLELLRECYEGGIKLAVLDPDGTAAKLVFSLDDILGAVNDGAPV